MWLLLEYDKSLQSQALEQLARAGIEVKALEREDQLNEIDKLNVELLLVGADWKPATLVRLREQGFDATCIYVVPQITDEVYKTAKSLFCQDAVTYPLPIAYLKKWAKLEAKLEVTVTTEPELSAMDQILQSNQVLNRKRTYTQNQANGNTSEVKSSFSRGRIIVMHSARGGVGKSITASLLAHYLAKKNNRVVAVDIDPRGTLLSMHRGQAAVTVDEWGKLPVQMDERMVKQSLVQVGNFYLLPGGKNRIGPDHSTVQRILYNLSQHFDYVIVDTTPADMSTVTALELAHRVLYVMTPEWTTFRRFIDEYEWISGKKGPENVTVIVNRIRSRDLAHKRTLRLLDEAKIESPIVHIPEDRKLYREVIAARPLVGSKKVIEGVHEIFAMNTEMLLKPAIKKHSLWGWF